MVEYAFDVTGFSKALVFFHRHLVTPRIALAVLLLNHDVRDIAQLIELGQALELFGDIAVSVTTQASDFATIDRSFRNDTGWWSALAGPFRWMDLTGIQAYGLVMKDLLPELANSGQIPRVMQEMLSAGAQGTADGRGFYDYDPQTAAAWQQAWVDFTFEIRKLVKKYEDRLQQQTGAGL